MSSVVVSNKTDYEKEMFFRPTLFVVLMRRLIRPVLKHKANKRSGTHSDEVN